MAAIAAVGAALALSGGSVTVAGALTNNRTGVAALTTTFARIEGLSRYRQSDWGYAVLDERSGRVVAAQNAQKMFDPGSTMKFYAVSAALSRYGSSYRFRTPVYRQGTVAGGVLSGNLVLVGSGDLTLGLREQGNGTLYYESLPKVDQSYATTGLPGAVEPPGNPLAVLNQLAARVRASGITRVAGNVVIDDRLFTPYGGFPDGLISPIWVNENLIDLLVRPGAVGRPASIKWRPMTASYVVDNRVRTVRAKQSTMLNASEQTPGRIVVSGQIAAGSPPTLTVWEIADPSAFARTAFIEALQRAGVTVNARATGPNPEALLPPRGSYRAADMIGQHVSDKLSQYVKLIMKVSYNRGADLMTCLAAVKLGSTACSQGLVAEVKTAAGLGVSRTSMFPFDGAGSDDQGRTTPAALATFVRRVVATPYGKTLFQALPILGRDGTLANVESKSPAAGHAQVKTGNRVVGTAAGQLLVLGNSLAGYAHTKSGRRVVFMIAVGNVPIPTPAAFLGVTADQARMVVAIQQDL
ncbi:MAG: D-alanyl-D-alanine carboxypeptidase/D-alanyl-D-alanine-endopeptidase [Solirubrobacterales bacterium]|nr:D-alanyl-D-alanine carboxypeptidase/D-alanyl-D-alanine-endopeptidase [Solirubrobacterales bacterium]